MPSKPACRTGQIDLAFSDQRGRPLPDGLVSENLSAIARVGACMFLACDEGAGIERLTRQDDGRFAAHQHISLTDFFDLPGGPDQEIDIEGLAAIDDYLWIVGSHALKRKKLKHKETDKVDLLQDMGELVCEPNRYFLGRVPMQEGPPGIFSLIRRVGERKSACLGMGGARGGLARWLRKDPLLAPFLTIPAKENGLDIEGIAVSGSRVWLGLRGPVLSGHAMVLELLLEETKSGRLKPARLEPEGRRYRRHLLDTGGLGIRDLRLDDEDLLLLVGPTMALEGTAHVLRWRRAIHDQAEGLVPHERLHNIADLPYSRDADHPEGLELWPEAGRSALLVVYDSPADTRLERAGRTVRADVILAGPS